MAITMELLLLLLLLLLILLLVSFDKVERGQVNASKRFIFDMPFLELPLRKPQMKNLQAILNLKKKGT